MRHRAVVASALCVWLLAVAGCAGPSGRNPFGESISSRHRKPSSIAGRTIDSKPAGSHKSDPNSPKPDGAAVAKTPDVLKDAQSRSLLNEEMRDASPEERVALLQMLRGKSPETARDILQARRIARTAAKPPSSTSPERTAAKVPATEVAAGTPWSQARPDSGKADSTPAATGSAKDPGVQTAAHSRALPPAPLAGPGTRSVLDEQGVRRAGPDLAAPPSQTVARAPIVDSAVAPAGAEEPGTVQAQSMRPAKARLPVLDDVDPTAPPEKVPSSEEVKSATVTASAEEPVSKDWRKSPEFQRLVDTAAREVIALKASPEGDNEDYIRRHVDLRMLYLMSGQSERALESIPGIEPADQMFWQQTFWGLHNYFDEKNIPAADERATQTVTQFTSAAQRLQQKASLQLRNVAFCQQISSYGSYERFPQSEFAPGQQVLLYAEVDNFHSEETDSGQQYRTILKSTVEIHRAGMPGDPQKIELAVPATEDTSRNRRRDYFHTYEFVIPPRLQPGPHVLRLTVEDTLTKKVATATVNFTVK